MRRRAGGAGPPHDPSQYVPGERGRARGRPPVRWVLARTWEDPLRGPRRGRIGSAPPPRRPELLWRVRRDDLSRLARLQVGIASACTDLVRPGGRLVYSVCTFPR